MIALVFCVLVLLTISNYLLGRSVFYPGFVYCATWTLAVFCLLVSGDMFYPVSSETLEIFMWGAIAFTLGSIAGKFVPLEFSPITQAEPRKVVNYFIALLIIAFPFYVMWVLGLIVDHPGDFLLASSHESFVELMDMGPEKYTLSYILFVNLLGFSPMVAMIAWAERKDRIKRALLAVLLAMLYYLPTGSRTHLIDLLIAILAVEWFTKKNLRLKHMAITASLGLAIFGTIAFVIHVPGQDVQDKISASFNELVVYVGAPLVAFDRVVRDPGIVPHNVTAATFFVETAAKLGISVDVPPRISQFVSTGPNNKGNVFTIYFSYLDIGMPIGCLLIGIQAFLLVLIYRAAVAGRKVAIVMAAYLLPYIALSTFTELIMLDLNLTLKTFVCCWLLYAFPVVKARFSRFLSLAAKEPLTLSHRDNQ